MINSPLFVVGMPRSGSTLLTRILNESDDLFIVNDFYYLQEVDAVGGFRELNKESSERLIDFIVEKLAGRSSRSGSRRLVESLLLKEEDISKIREHLEGLLSRGSVAWDGLLAEGLGLAARCEGKKIWGYNTPQDFLNISILKERFPRAKFLFLVRNPYDMLRSYKNVHDDGNDPKRYHPLVQGILWRFCVQKYQEVSGDQNVFLLRYEDLVGNPQDSIEKVSQFIGVDIPCLDLKKLGRNSSFGKGTVREITPTEIAILNKVIGSFLPSVSYDRLDSKVRVRDFGEVARISMTCVLFYLGGILRSKNIRRRVVNAFRRT